jgi:drug/metabolite transporter (DMT)-like permease
VKTADLARLLSLAAIWGASFLFLRLLSPALGAAATVELRVLIAGLALLAGLKAARRDIGWKRYARHYAVIGAVNTALPFYLFSFGALHLPSSCEVILNSTAPLFGAVFAALWLGEALTRRKLAGLGCGMIGVALIAGFGTPGADAQAGISIAACLVGASCYGLAGVYIRTYAREAPPAASAACSQLFAALLLSPSLVGFPVSALTPVLLLCLLALSLLCSGVAYLLYFRLIADLGPSRALTVTFLMPGFGMVWGALFLHEQITPLMIAGALLIVAGTAGVLAPAAPAREKPLTAAPARSGNGR